MEARERFSKLVLLAFFIFFLFAILQFLAPTLTSANSITDLSGLTLVSDNNKEIENIPFPLKSIYIVGDRLCHQKSERSFFINGNQMPFCARCTAIWVGLVMGIGILIFYKINLDFKFLILIFVGLIPILIDGLGQLFGFWESNNFIRVITGGLIGIICGMAIGIIIEEIKFVKSLIKNKN